MSIHVAASILGLLILTGSLALGGLEQGKMLNDASIAFNDITQAMLPWFTARTAGLGLLAIGHGAFFINFFWSICPRCAATARPANFSNPPALTLTKGPFPEGHA